MHRPAKYTCLSPDLLSEINKIHSDILLLKGLKAEVSQIMETIQKTTPSQYPKPITEQTNMFIPCQVYPPYRAEANPVPNYQHPQTTAVQRYQPMLTNEPMLGTRQMRGTAQFQQRFAPQCHYHSPHPYCRCYGCIQAGEGYSHCFRCGSSEHFSAGCRADRMARPVSQGPLN